MAAEPTAKELNQIANVICWNIWQMDGLKGTIPGKELYISDDYEQLSLFASDFEQETLFDEAAKQNKKYECKIRDWRAMRTISYNQMKGKSDDMKFDYAIGNPPYQDTGIGDNTKAPSVYNYFLESGFEVATVVEMIHPARFCSMLVIPIKSGIEKCFLTHIIKSCTIDRLVQAFSRTQILKAVSQLPIVTSEKISDL